MFFLYVTYPTGRTSVLTFPTLFDRALQMIVLGAQPVTLRIAEAA